MLMHAWSGARGQVGRECRGAALNPNELAAVIRVVDALADSPSAADGGWEEMLVPDVGGRLVPASACFRADNPQVRALTQTHEPTLVSFGPFPCGSLPCCASGLVRMGVAWRGWGRRMEVSVLHESACDN